MLPTWLSGRLERIVIRGRAISPENLSSPFIEQEPQAGPWKDLHPKLVEFVRREKKAKNVFGSKMLRTRFIHRPPSGQEIPMRFDEDKGQTYILRLGKQISMDDMEFRGDPINISWLSDADLPQFRFVRVEFTPSGATLSGVPMNSDDHIPLVLSEDFKAVAGMFEIFKSVASARQV